MATKAARRMCSIRNGGANQSVGKSAFGLVLTAWLAALLTLLEIPLRSSLLVVLVLASLTFIGRTMLTWSRLLDLPVGASLTLGAGLLVFVSQSLLVAGTSPSFAHWPALITLLGISLLLKYRTSGLSLIIQPRGGSEFEAVAILTLLAMSIRHPWLFPFAALSLLSVRLSRSSFHPAFLVPGAFLLVTLGYLGSLSMRPTNWWYFYQGNDAQFFESLSWSISHWGIFEHPGVVGSSLSGYHWFVYGFMGSLSHLANLAPWEAIMKVGAPLLQFGLASVLIGSPSSHGKIDFYSRLPAGLIGLLCLPLVRVDSFAFSLLAAMVFLSCAAVSRGSGGTSRKIVVLALLAITLILGKTSTAVVVLLILVGELLIARLRKAQTSILAPVTLALSGFALFFAFFRSTSATTGVARASFDARASLSEFQAFFDEPTLVLVVCLWLLSLNFLARRDSNTSETLYSATLFSVPLLIAGWMYQASGTSWYFGTPALFLLMYLAIRRTSWDYRTLRANKLTPLVLTSFFVTLLLGFLHDRLMDRLENHLRFSSVLGEFWWDIVKNSGFAILLVALISVVGFFSRQKRMLISVSLVFVVLAFTAGNIFNSYRATAAAGSSSYENWGGNSSPFPQDDLRQLAGWIRSNTPQDAILASNNFCCSGVEWWNQIALNPELHLVTVFGEGKWGGANYLLPAETRRRFLMQGLRFQVGYGLPTEDQIDRLTTSLEFANSPSNKTHHKLLEYGVTGFVVNLSLTEQHDWSQFATERARSGSFLFLELKTNT